MPPLRGDRDQEFVAFVADSGPALARTAWLLCGDVHQADELVQQALVRTWLAWDRAREREPLAYARRVLANQRVSTWRRRSREVLAAAEHLPERAVEGGQSLHDDRDQLARALATLTPRQRRVVVLRHLEGLSEQEVADDLGISVGTVKSTASRALRQLRETMDRSTHGSAGPGAGGAR
ncbi:RNA polymerase, sigma-24 subunit, ECF subfamily [Cellulomonas flavigena DSM 20109]|uniref:RNA polymerase, sigma-24 subunit, ECF subfamily n=1 Tax=Cellulomonas flavigena (strain ATCC 482 / DSM 20109 / BCRC 11376 / JCM 18109 / NBRC 3775 / NCIMB 8073 / NRS 134) TaxID=446466 RepID=D5UI49_CELFN|nr:SigE family RNA polymerase sigma factor [Cellulomonas flavigena]ADG75394.1 RNA polymerase, sigma-24 subunit, ECF subfamily [Cellulomonas flavigena DSM 20109]